MEVVRVFNNELSSLYEGKPPISKAKMTHITKCAIKGLKFYKHIVQSVEKFIQKCRPEYKVPGLYVIDSIVRQSRHQFGADKDVFGPRFVKNITVTFQHLFKCSDDDRPKIIRVLNLWQKNNVFSIDVIQPLMDMGHPSSSSDAVEDSQGSQKQKGNESHWKSRTDEPPPPEQRTYAEMSTKNLAKFTKAEMTSAYEESSQATIYRIQPESAQEDTVKFNKKLLDFDYGDEEDEEESKNEENHLANHPNALALSMAQNILSNPELLKKLQQMQQTIAQNEALKTELGLIPRPDDNTEDYPMDTQTTPPQETPLNSSLPQSVSQLETFELDSDDRMLHQPPLPPQDFDGRSIMAPQALPNMSNVSGIGVDKDERVLPDATVLPKDLDERSLNAILAPLSKGVLPPMPFTEPSTMIPYQSNVPFPPQQPPLPLMEPMALEGITFPPTVPPERLMGDEDERVMYSMPGEPPLPPQDYDERSIMVPQEERERERSSRKDRSRSRSQDRSRSRRSRRSRSKSPRRKRSRSRDRDRDRDHKSTDRSSERSKDRERLKEKEREREKESQRKRRGLPPIKKGCVSVCSTTIWIGHVPKQCAKSDITEPFEKFGPVLSVDMIPPRGCAYIVMEKRQDGYKALQKLKKHKIHNSVVKMAWAPGKGVKGKEFKSYWEVDPGVSYIPFEKITPLPNVLDKLEEGGSIDDESLSDTLKALRVKPEDNPPLPVALPIVPTTTALNALPPTPNPTMVPPPPIMPPTSVGMPMVMPHLMQPQFGLHLPGLLPPHRGMVMQVPMGIPPPNPMMMVPRPGAGLLNNPALSMVGGLPPMVPRTLPTVQSMKDSLASPMVTPMNTGDATPTDEDGTSEPPPKPTQNPLPPTMPQFPPMGGFGFPPLPGMRPPGQFPPGWPQQKPFEGPPRPLLMQPGIRMFNSRQPELPPKNPDQNKDGDKHSQEMVISTDDEASMDNFNPNDVPFPGGGNDFNRMGMHRMRSPGRFQQGMPMDSPQGRGGWGGGRGGFDPRGPRMPGRDGNQQEFRDWYPRDYDEPPPHMDRERGRDRWSPDRFGGDSRYPQDNRRRDDRGFDDRPNRGWKRDEREFNRDDRDLNRDDRDLNRDDRNLNRDDRNPNRDDRNLNRDDREFNNGSNRQEPPKSEKRPVEKKPVNKNKPKGSSMDQLLKLRFYQGDKGAMKELEKKREEEKFKKESNNNNDSKNGDGEAVSDDPPKNTPDAAPIAIDIGPGAAAVKTNAQREKDREARKRSRWGRTLSEEREIQEQRRNEIEMKIKGYEKDAHLQPPPAVQILPDNQNTQIPSNTPIQNTNSVPSTDTNTTLPLKVETVGLSDSVDFIMPDEDSHRSEVPNPDTQIDLFSNVDEKPVSQIDLFSNVAAKVDAQIDSFSNVAAKADTQIDLFSNVAAKADAEIDLFSNVAAKADAEIDLFSNVAAKADTQIDLFSNVVAKPDTPIDLFSNVKDVLIHLSSTVLPSSVGDDADASAHKPVMLYDSEIMEGLPVENSVQSATVVSGGDQSEVCLGNVESGEHNLSNVSEEVKLDEAISMDES